jgi:hypothetical protein
MSMPRKPALLILDYPGRRPEAHISDLGLERLGFDCQYLLTHPLPGEVGTTEYARELTARAEIPAHGAVAILSYCASAPLAAAVASRLAVEKPPPIVFFDPSQCHRYHIIDGYAAVVRQIEGSERADGGRPLFDVEPGIAQPALLIAAIADDLLQRARTELTADGFGEVEADEPLEHVVSMYVQWLTFLLAVHHRPAGTPMGEVLHVISQRHPEDLGWLGTGNIRTVRIGCDRPSLARGDETRDVVEKFIDQVA